MSLERGRLGKNSTAFSRSKCQAMHVQIPQSSKIKSNQERKQMDEARG